MRTCSALEGIALLEAWTGDHDQAFTEARLAEIRRLLDDEKLRGQGVLAERVSSVTAYEQQSASYDAHAGGGLFAADERVVAECLGCSRPLGAAFTRGGPATRPRTLTRYVSQAEAELLMHWPAAEIISAWTMRAELTETKTRDRRAG